MNIYLISATIYLIIGLLGIRPIAGHFAWNASNRWSQVKPDSSDWFGAYAAAIFSMILWPLALVIFFGGVIFPTIGAEKLHKLEQEKRQLEQEKADWRKQQRDLDLEEWE